MCISKLEFFKTRILHSDTFRILYTYSSWEPSSKRGRREEPSCLCVSFSLWRWPPSWCPAIVLKRSLDEDSEDDKLTNSPQQVKQTNHQQRMTTTVLRPVHSTSSSAPVRPDASTSTPVPVQPDSRSDAVVDCHPKNYADKTVLSQEECLKRGWVCLIEV